MHALITSLHDTPPRASVPAPLLSTHLSLLTRHASLLSLLPHAKNVTKLARRYTSSEPGRTDPRVWLARLEAEQTFPSSGGPSGLQKSCQEARTVVRGDGVIDVWFWQLCTSIEGLDEEGALKEMHTLEVCNNTLQCHFEACH